MNNKMQELIQKNKEKAEKLKEEHTKNNRSILQRYRIRRGK